MTTQKDEEEFQEEISVEEEQEGTAEFESATYPKQVFTTDEELKNLHKELMGYKDKYLRVLAESDNARKRLQKERQEMTRYAVENIVIDFLRPLDNLENALRFAQDMSDDVRNWAFGFQMILAQFKDVLASNGVIAVDSQGKAFDPHAHEAIEMVETDDYPSGMIVEESVKGYKMGERIIRAARVKVSKSKSDTAASQE
jgi:molecular chaperone GrpE